MGEQFRVGAQFGALHAGGQLAVDEGELCLRPSVAARTAHKWLTVPDAPEPTEVRHVDDDVEIVVSRLLPPWMSVRVVVVGPKVTAVAVLPRWELSRLRRALTGTRFRPRVDRRWIYTADDRVKPWP
jgi:hypothetical protein